MTGHLTYDAHVARLEDLGGRAGRRRRATRERPTCTAEPVTIRLRLRPRWTYRAA